MARRSFHKLKEILYGVSVEVNEDTNMLSRLPDVVSEWPIVLRQSMYTSEFNLKLLGQSTIIGKSLFSPKVGLDLFQLLL